LKILFASLGFVLMNARAGIQRVKHRVAFRPTTFFILNMPYVSEAAILAEAKSKQKSLEWFEHLGGAGAHLDGRIQRAFPLQPVNGKSVYRRLE
jgi:hypothetical protein